MAADGQNLKLGERNEALAASPAVSGATANAFSPLAPPETPDTPLSSGALSLMQPLVNFADISFKEKVGHGSYGVVYKAVWNDRYVAVKEFGPSAEQKAIETEVKQLSRVRHHNIIALFGISADQQSKYLIMEYAEGGSLHNFLHGKVKPYYSPAHAMSWARQCAEGVAYLHAMKPKPLIHRDLKPLNLLLTNKGRLLKIGDFGTVVDKSTWMTNNKGSAAWMAPEVFEGSKYTEKCDIFSWAIVLWEVLSRQQPFKEIDNTYSIMWKIHKGERPPMIKDCPEPIANLLTSCWATVPDLRPSMQHVVAVMNELASSFPGEDEPLEYEFVNQQIICNNTNSEENADNYTLDFSSYYSSGGANSTASTQVTPTNTTSNIHSTTSATAAPSSSSSSTPTPTNTPAVTDLFNPHANVPLAAITGTSRWDAIPEESEASVFYSCDATAAAAVQSDPFRLTPSAAAAQRYETIRNNMSQMASFPMAPVSIHVDPNAWDLSCSESASSFAKSDGKERLTVTDAKPMMEPNATNNNINNNNAHPADDSDDDDDENDGPDQSLHEMLDPELQPEPPIADNPESQQIYREHRRMAKEHLRGDTNYYYAQDYKEKLLAQINPAERQEKLELLKKMREEEDLLELYNNLKQQLSKIRTGQMDAAAAAAAPNASGAASAAAMHRQLSQDSGVSASEAADDGWVVIPPNQHA